ncbi:hypothetical protein RIF29_04083 [Crotalaria pallida]|uniref:glycerophosphodiester phosphodiesterase n=1 Tax=Crotalaria pallida TaxID=3830 RepID=A0AAN9J1E9_CROPI
MQQELKLDNAIDISLLQVFVSDLVKDVPLGYNFSYDPLVECLVFFNNGKFSVDSLLSDFPIETLDLVWVFAIGLLVQCCDIVSCIVVLRLAAKYLECVRKVTLTAPPYSYFEGNDACLTALAKIAGKKLWSPIPFGSSFMSWHEHLSQCVCLVFYRNNRIWGTSLLYHDLEDKVIFNGGGNVMTLLAYAAVGLTLNINACCLALDAHHLFDSPMIKIPKLMAFIYKDQRVMLSPNISKVYYLDQAKATFIVVLQYYIVCVMDAYQILFLVANAEDMEVKSRKAYTTWFFLGKCWAAQKYQSRMVAKQEWELPK